MMSPIELKRIIRIFIISEYAQKKQGFQSLFPCGVCWRKNKKNPDVLPGFNIMK